MARGTVKGVSSLRRLLRKLPDESRKELADELTAIGARLIGRAKNETPVRTGRLKAALAFRVAAKTLQLRLGLVKKADRRRFFYGYILDAGRKGKVGKSRSGRNYTVTPIPASRYEFIFGRRRDFQQNEIPKMRAALERVLKRASQGVGND